MGGIGSEDPLDHIKPRINTELINWVWVGETKTMKGWYRQKKLVSKNSWCQKKVGVGKKSWCRKKVGVGKKSWCRKKKLVSKNMKLVVKNMKLVAKNVKLVSEKKSWYRKKKLVIKSNLARHSQTVSIERIERRINWTQSNNCDSIVERNRIAIEYYPGFAIRLLRLRSIVFDYVRLRSIDSIVFDFIRSRTVLTCLAAHAKKALQEWSNLI